MLPIQIFHKHVPLLGESPPHEVHCSQWGDQHTEGEPQPDESQGGGEWNIRRLFDGEENNFSGDVKLVVGRPLGSIPSGGEGSLRFWKH